MHKKIVGIFALLLVVLSPLSLAQDVDCKALIKEDKEKAKEAGCKLPKSGGKGSFHLAEDQKLSELLKYPFKGLSLSEKAKLDFQSQYEGKGFGIAVGNVFKGQTKRFTSLAGGSVKELKVTATGTQLGLNAIHLKTVETNAVLAVEFLTNLKKADYTLVVKVPTKEAVTFLLNGQEVKAVKLKSTSNSFDYYRLTVHQGGLLEAMGQ